MLTEMRRALRGMLDACGAARPPALRRAEGDDWLLATDAPGLLDEAALAALRARLEASGWRTALCRGWLLLDGPLTPPETTVPAVLPEGEVGCVISLLLRHPGGPEDAATVRALVKAAEAGGAALERLCGGLHREMAARLRRGEALPGGLLPWVLAASEQAKREGKDGAGK